VYRAGFLQYAELALRAGRNRVDALYAQVPAREISPATLREHGFAADLFRNLNTPQDWDAAQADLQERAAR
jgi:molybdopterin-guanine dinucleotide biosynthesis protein A